MLVDLEVFYLGHLKNLYTIQQYNTILSLQWSYQESYAGITQKCAVKVRLRRVAFCVAR